MDRNLVCEWQRVQLQPAIDDNHVQLHVPDKNAVPDHGSLFDITLPPIVLIATEPMPFVW